MAFKSEIHVAELASIKTGHTEGDIYYILDNGMLGDIPCRPGSFVRWHNDAWQILSGEHYALASDVDGEVAEAVGNILDDGSTSETVIVSVPSSQAGDYEVGKYYKVQNGVAKLRTKTVGESVTELTFDTQSGVLEAINNAAGALIATYNVTNYATIKAAYDAGKRIILVADTPNDPDDIVIADLFYYHVATGAVDKDSFTFTSIYRNTEFRFTITDPASWSCDTNTLAYIGLGTQSYPGGSITSVNIGGQKNNSLVSFLAPLQTDHINFYYNGTDIPNFCIEFELGGSDDCTVGIYQGSSSGTHTQLKKATAANGTLTPGKFYQITVVGTCWTVAEFEIPTP